MKRNPTNSGEHEVGTSSGVVYTISDDQMSAPDRERSREDLGEKQPRCDQSQMRDDSYGTTATGALIHLMKSSISTGTLAMSNAFKNGGLIFGVFGTLLVGMLCAHCIYLLVVSSQALSKRTRRQALGFADTAAAAFSTGPRRIRAWSRFASEFVNAALFCTYYFGNCVYVILISASFKQVADAHSSSEWQFSIRAWILGLALPLLPLGCVRSLQILVPFSAVATAFILVGLGCTMTRVSLGVSPFSGEKAVPLPDIRSRPWIAPFGQTPLLFTTILFAMESIGTVLPIENSMRRPERFLSGPPCGVLTAAMTLVVILYGTTGFLGYLRFGDTTKGSITLNLPNDIFSEVVKIMVALSIIISYGLQFCVPSEIVWNRLGPWLHKRRQNATRLANGKDPTKAVEPDAGSNSTAISATSVAIEIETARPDERNADWAYYVMRATMILITFLIAAIVPNLAPIVSLFGAVFFSVLGLLCPAAIHLATFWEHGDTPLDGANPEGGYGCKVRPHGRRAKTKNRPRERTAGMSRWTVAKDVAIIVIALIALVSGSYVSMLNILAFYGSDENQ